jgi:hypothetical protein
VVHALLDQSEGPLTRRAILHRWPDAAVAPAKLTLWKWLGRTVREGRVLQAGRGTRREPFRYQLPGMAEKWQQRFLASFLNRLAQDETGQGPEGLEAPLPEVNQATPAVPQVRLGEAPMLVDPVPPPERRPAPAGSASAPPDPPAAATPDLLGPPAAEAPVRLPYPYSLMNPAEVPEAVWQQARAVKRNE